MDVGFFYKILSKNMKPAILRVALKAPLPELFDYLPPETGPRVLVGQRVIVPFGRSERVGVIAELANSTAIADNKLKRAARVLDEHPLLDESLVELLNWAASYYQHAPGDVFAAALPGPLRKGADACGKQEPHWRISSEGRIAIEAAMLKAPVQKLVLEAIASNPKGIDQELLTTVHQGWQRAVRELEKKQLVEKFSVAIEPPIKENTVGRKELKLNEHQKNAVDKITIANNDTWLLQGVTGSGKTEVYLRLIRHQLDAGKQALVIVPEIGLTPQLVARFEEQLDIPITLMHSNLSDSQRLQAWLDAKEGAAGVLIGTRSAIFTPFKALGLIIVDEEHDASLKQQEGFRYSARDIAIMRGRKLNIPVVLGSATPSFETLANAHGHRYQHVCLPVRAGGARQPSVRLIDLRLHIATDGLTIPMVETIRKHLEQNGQILVYLNRRGFAPTLFCSDCRSCVECPRCDSRLVVHQQRELAICHHCGFETKVPEKCPGCKGELHPLGQGTERIETALKKYFPDEIIVRLDRDSTRRRGAIEKHLETIRSGKAQILLGTQMLTKGHDFPNVTLVCILDADQGLFGTDFRSGERMAQNFIQVSGRAGRADRRGEVWIQTLHPDHPQLLSLLNKGYEGYAKTALAERKTTLWPPFSHIALLRAECNNKETLYSFLDNARQLAEQINPGSVRILGPASAPMERRSGRWRAQILLQSEHRPSLQALLTAWRRALNDNPASRKARWSIDVDPIELF
ncbi:MAG: primosomal protein N' [Gammaproteobacteria bacterium]|nr:primosomal protein N' [Gammaproteobacteria bacterium]